MILSDRTIKSLIINKEIWLSSPKFDIDFKTQIWPCSLDLRLMDIIKIYKVDNYVIDTREKGDYTTKTAYIENKGFILKPWRFILASTIEKIRIPDFLCAKCEGRSSLWRLGVQIHATAWFIDAWFKWNITLEISNIWCRPVKIFAWMRICQIVFSLLDKPSEVPYGDREGSKYQNQTLPTASKLYLDKDL